MAAKDPKTYLWANICSLMGDESPSIDAVQKRIGIGRGTVQRIKEGTTSVGVDVLATIASAFKLQPWQLLVPGLDPRHLPTLQIGPVPPPFSDDLLRAASADPMARAALDLEALM